MSLCSPPLTQKNTILFFTPFMVLVSYFSTFGFHRVYSWGCFLLKLIYTFIIYYFKYKLSFTHLLLSGPPPSPKIYFVGQIWAWSLFFHVCPVSSLSIRYRVKHSLFIFYHSIPITSDTIPLCHFVPWIFP